MTARSHRDGEHRLFDSSESSSDTLPEPPPTHPPTCESAKATSCFHDHGFVAVGTTTGNSRCRSEALSIQVDHSPCCRLKSCIADKLSHCMLWSRPVRLATRWKNCSEACLISVSLLQVHADPRREQAFLGSSRISDCAVRHGASSCGSRG